MKKTIELEIIEGYELDFLSPYILDYVEGNKITYLFDKEKSYDFPLAYNESKITKLTNLLIDEEEAEKTMIRAYDVLKKKDRKSGTYKEIIGKPVEEFLDSNEGRDIVSLIQSHIITSYSDKDYVNYIDKQFSLYFASSYFYFKNTIKSFEIVKPKDKYEAKRIYDHLRALMSLIEFNNNNDVEIYIDEISDPNKSDPNLFDDIDGFTIVINKNRLVSTIDREIDERIFIFYSEDNELPDIFIKVPQEYYVSVMLDESENYSFDTWFDFIDLKKISYNFSDSYYSRILLEEAIESDNAKVLDGIAKHYNRLITSNKFNRSDYTSNTVSTYNKYYIKEMYELIDEHYSEKTQYSKQMITATILAELGIAYSLETYPSSYKQPYRDYLKNFVKNNI